MRDARPLGSYSIRSVDAPPGCYAENRTRATRTGSARATGGGMMAIAGKLFVDELRGIVAGRHTRDHPFVRRIADGELAQGELRFFAQQYYQRTARMFPKLVAAIYSRTPDDPELEHMLLENVFSESGFEDPT